MKKYTKFVVSLCLGISATFAHAYDGGAFPGYVASPSATGSNTLITTQFGECVKNQYFQADYQRGECGEVINRQNLNLNSKVLFAFDKYNLSESGQLLLKHIVEQARKNGEITYVSIIGHTDTLGIDKENQILSENRANAVGDYLVSLGIDASYINAKGVGKAGANVSGGCLDKAGADPSDKIIELTDELQKSSGTEKIKIQNELDVLNERLDKLANCTSPDRRVDIVIETKALANPQT